MRTDLLWASAFGVAFVVASIILAIAFPRPTPFQLLVFRTTLALSAGGAAAAIPGFFNLSVDFTGVIARAGGALAVFVLVYKINPAHILTGSESHRRDDQHPLLLKDGFFIMAATLKAGVATDILQEVKLLQDTGLGGPIIENRIIERLDKKIEYERSSMAAILARYDSPAKTEEAGPEALLHFTLSVAPIRAASDRTIEVLTQCKMDFTATSGQSIESRIALCKQRLIALKEEGERDERKFRPTR
jgi:hypothetical protein